MSTPAAPTTALTQQEAEMYDRQIRLWGVKAQKGILSSKIMIIGVEGLACEVTKNLILAGVGEICLMDDHKCTAEDLSANFFLTEADIGKNRATASQAKLQELNPRCKVHVIEGLKITEETFKNYHIVMTFNRPLKEQIKINDICRKLNVYFFSGICFGLFAFFFQDFLDFKYVRDNDPTKEEIPISYQPLSHIWQNADWKKAAYLTPTWVALQSILMFEDKHGKYPQNVSDLQKLLKSEILSKKTTISEIDDNLLGELINNANSGELNPVCAIVGGVAAQEVIKSIAKEGTPVHNYFVFEGAFSSSGYIEKVL